LQGEQPDRRRYSARFRRTIRPMRRWLALLSLAPLTSLAAVIAVNEPWVRPAAMGASTYAFMELTVSEAATLVDVRTAAASTVALARGAQRQAPPFALPLTARETLLMRDVGTRIELRRARHALKRGDRVPLTLVLRYADGTLQEVEVDAEVRRRSPSDDHRGAHRH
jgi:copper(I)-binding protein